MASAAQQSDSPYIDPDFVLKGAESGPLTGLTFAVKDMFDIKGVTTGFGNPTWLATHEPAKTTCPSVQALLDAGATLKGRTHMDELAFSLNGENYHYGTPKNPAAPNRIPGGSSSGSASAVALGDVDFGVGSDTGGSVRVPASFTGVLGIRPTHGRVSLQGAYPLGETYDTCGWLTRDPSTLQKVGSVLLNKSTKGGQTIKRWLIGTDAFALADQAVQDVIFKVVKSRRSDFDTNLGEMSEVVIAPESAGLGTTTDWVATFRVIQAAEAWRDLGEWIQKENPTFGPGTKERFEGAAKLTQKEWDDAKADRLKIIEHVTQILGDDAVLVIPTSPGPAPVLGIGQEELNAFRLRLLSLTCIAGNCKLFQISIPVGSVEGAPIGLSIIGPSGSDEALLEIVQKLYPLVS